MDKSKLILKEEEILRYLGYRGQEIPKDIRKKILDVKEECKEIFTPRYIYEEYTISKNNNEIIIDGTSLILRGNDIKSLLKNSERCILMAVTLGNDIERKTRIYEKTDLTKGVIIDACATTAVEEVCDLVEEEITKEILKEGEGLTFRYSPGYGDLGLEVQREFLNVLNCERRIGLKVSEHMILFPRKSVTAIIGIEKKNNNIKHKKSCKNCNNYNNCMYRKEDGTSGCERFT